MCADVCIIGAGPAGACAALNLAPFHHTVVLERRDPLRRSAVERPVETLPPVAGVVLRDMGLLESHLSQRHGRWQAKRSAWESDHPVETDLLSDPDGLGWILDRGRFRTWLWQQAVCRGAEVRDTARCVGLDRQPDGWIVHVRTPAGPETIRAAIVIDGSGRPGSGSAALGHRTRTDRLACCWLSYSAVRPSQSVGSTWVQAAPGGWWFSAVGGDGTGMIGFHTDWDLSPFRSGDALLRAARATPGLSELCPDSYQSFGTTTAHSAALAPFCGAGWYAVGDAAFSVDPVSSQGMLDALVSGLAAAHCAAAELAGQPSAHADYQDFMTDRIRRYHNGVAACYRAVRRFRHHPFWHRRFLNERLQKKYRVSRDFLP